MGGIAKKEEEKGIIFATKMTFSPVAARGEEDTESREKGGSKLVWTYFFVLVDKNTVGTVLPTFFFIFSEYFLGWGLERELFSSASFTPSSPDLITAGKP